MKSYKSGDLQFPYRPVRATRRPVAWSVWRHTVGGRLPPPVLVVVVTHAEEELFAPVRAELWGLLAGFGLIAVLVLAVAIPLSVRLVRRPSGRTRTSPNTRRRLGSNRRLAPARASPGDGGARVPDVRKLVCGKPWRLLLRCAFCSSVTTWDRRNLRARPALPFLLP